MCHRLQKRDGEACGPTFDGISGGLNGRTGLNTEVQLDSKRNEIGPKIKSTFLTFLSGAISRTIIFQSRALNGSFKVGISTG
ncbi:unnamed protein product [Protopolystoma xenopodis]|uniref:Uncharacterized protein n=1 Tax=Protopolystoma xenopodis TaxID=117903 RepID=A0A3S5AVA2_9PLAT|nr:unnamed protein product [Protopolystoma xenopodis]